MGPIIAVSISPTPSTASRGSVADDQIFRLILIAGFAIIMPPVIYHRVKSQASGESLDRRQEGLFVLATLRPLALASMLGLIAYTINPASMAWSAVVLPA